MLSDYEFLVLYAIICDEARTQYGDYDKDIVATLVGYGYVVQSYNVLVASYAGLAAAGVGVLEDKGSLLFYDTDMIDEEDIQAEAERIIKTLGWDT